MLTQALAECVLRRDLGGAWEVSVSGGSLGNTRLAVSGDTSVVLKLGQPAAALRRLAELGVTPPVMAWGELEGAPYTIQRMAVGFQPDPTWFASHMTELADLVRRYQRDGPLAAVLHDDPSRERLDVAVAASMLGDIPPRPGSPLWTEQVLEARHEWRRQAGELDPVPPVPVHADPHWGNYVVEGGRLYLVDWDQVDLSDPWRDAGVQLWWHVPTARWPDFVALQGAALDEALRNRIYWWVGFKALRTGYWVDARGDKRMAEAHARAFVAAMARRDWDGKPD